MDYRAISIRQFLLQKGIDVLQQFERHMAQLWALLRPYMILAIVLGHELPHLVEGCEW